MNPTLLNIITGVFVISCVCSMLFVLTRTYFCYFAKSKKCSGNCSCGTTRDGRLPDRKEVIEASVEKFTYGEPMGYDDDVKVNVAIIPTAKKKPGRKKKVKEL
jgi:hypothetical protein